MVVLLNTKVNCICLNNDGKGAIEIKGPRKKKTIMNSVSFWRNCGKCGRFISDGGLLPWTFKRGNKTREMRGKGAGRLINLMTVSQVYHRFDGRRRLFSQFVLFSLGSRRGYVCICSGVSVCTEWRLLQVKQLWVGLPIIWDRRKWIQFFTDMPNPPEKAQPALDWIWVMGFSTVISNLLSSFRMGIACPFSHKERDLIKEANLRARDLSDTASQECVHFKASPKRVVFSA